MPNYLLRILIIVNVVIDCLFDNPSLFDGDHMVKAGTVDYLGLD